MGGLCGNPSARPKSALIIVDVQNDFCEGGSLAVGGSLEIIPVINKLREDKLFDVIITTRDYHQADHVSFAENHPGEKLFTKIIVEETGREQMMWPTHCVVGTPGCEYHQDLVVKKTDKEILKGTVKMVESYSGFGGDGEETGLNKYLKQQGIKQVFSVGLAYDYCVGSTAVDAAKNGYKSYLINDASRSVSDETKSVMTERLQKAGVSVIDLESLNKFRD